MFDYNHKAAIVGHENRSGSLEVRHQCILPHTIWSRDIPCNQATSTYNETPHHEVCGNFPVRELYSNTERNVIYLHFTGTHSIMIYIPVTKLRCMDSPMRPNTENTKSYWPKPLICLRCYPWRGNPVFIGPHQAHQSPRGGPPHWQAVDVPWLNIPVSAWDMRTFDNGLTQDEGLLLTRSRYTIENRPDGAPMS